MAGGLIGSIIGSVLTGGAGSALGAGIGAAIPSVAEIAKVIVDRTIPDPQKKAEAQAEIEQALTARETALTAALQAQNEQQNAINLAEAQGNDRFSSRWRPAAGWMCVAGLAYQYIFAPIVTWVGALIGTVLGFAFPAPPTLVMNDLWPILAGLLGIGVMRTYERTTGVPGVYELRARHPGSDRGDRAAHVHGRSDHRQPDSAQGTAGRAGLNGPRLRLHLDHPETTLNRPAPAEAVFSCPPAPPGGAFLFHGFFQAEGGSCVTPLARRFLLPALCHMMMLSPLAG